MWHLVISVVRISAMNAVGNLALVFILGALMRVWGFAHDALDLLAALRTSCVDPIELLLIPVMMLLLLVACRSPVGLSADSLGFIQFSAYTDQCRWLVDGFPAGSTISKCPFKSERLQVMWYKIGLTVLGHHRVGA